MAGAAHSTTVKKSSIAAKAPDLQAAYPRTHFEKAYYFKQKHDLNNALIEFIKSTQENPLLVRGFYEQALIFRERGYLKLAASSLEQALAAKPDYQDARILLATISIQQGNVGIAVKELTRSLGLESTDNRKEGEKQNRQSIALQKITKDVGAKVRDADALFDAMPSVILQSIHAEIKNEKVKEPAVAKENTPLVQEKTAVSDKATASTVADTQNKHFDLATIRDSIEAAIHAPFSLSNYWNHLPFGSAETSEKATEKENDKVADQSVEPKNVRHKKEKKQKHKHKQDDSIKTAVTESSRQTEGESLAAQKNDSADTTEMLPDFVKKAIADHKEAEESAAFAAQAASSATQTEKTHLDQDESSNITMMPESNKTLFSSTNFSQSTHAIIKGLKNSDSSSDSSKKEPQASAPESSKQSPVQLDNDQWAIKLRDLVEHGTNSLKDGEAFMFAEDTGEASLFLADGSVIRRIVQLPRDQTEIVRQRRPDMLIPDDLLYKLSLLGKLIPHPDTAAEAISPSNIDNQSNPQASQKPAKDFKVDNVMGESQNFWGWLKSAFKF